MVTWDDLDQVAHSCRGVTSVLSGFVLHLGNIPHGFPASVADQVLSAPLQAANTEYHLLCLIQQSQDMMQLHSA